MGLRDFYNGYLKKIMFPGILIFLLYLWIFDDSYLMGFYTSRIERIINQRLDTRPEKFQYKNVSFGEIIVFAQFDIDSKEITTRKMHTLSKEDVIWCDGFKPKIMQTIESLRETDSLKGIRSCDICKYYEVVVIDSLKSKLYYIYIDG